MLLNPCRCLGDVLADFLAAPCVLRVAVVFLAGINPPVNRQNPRDARFAPELVDMHAKFHERSRTIRAAGRLPDFDRKFNLFRRGVTSCTYFRRR